jgi:hypothetical protein
VTGFRGSDEALDREIAAIERVAKLRVRRVSAELRELDRELRELRRERARRRADTTVLVPSTVPAEGESA